MNTTRKLLMGVVALIATAATSTAFATNYVLQFSGQTDTGNYSGSFVLDYSVMDSDPSDSIGEYGNIVTGGMMTVNGIEYVVSSTLVNTGFIYNNVSGIGDYLGFGFTVTNTSNGEDDFFAIQFQQLDGSAFSTAELPTSLDLTAFEPYDINNTNSTGVILPIPGLGGTDVYFALGAASLTPVPLPAGLLLLLSALATLKVSRKRTV